MDPLDKNVRKRLWSKGKQASQAIGKSGLFRNKLMLCIWWGWKVIIHFEILAPGKPINLDLYCQRLMRFEQEVEQKRLKLINKKGMIFHHDNARPHISLATRQILREFGWEVLIHPS
ncbi:Histone-lysine N-methyltransferase SETMAR [Eumeta japonica]|uniref:Histone-lysine N-methyltransferase SETMAR n=1 Tax=Eumeta variegata TaxID=151549 RepID=A0A4C1UD85_EUMVA|nr:Histone-lysine N-methyltransferase SETMAR [Eumeta japonica]